MLAFWSDAAVLVRPGERMAPLAVLDLLLRVPARGLTNVAFAVSTAARLIADSSSRGTRPVAHRDHTDVAPALSAIFAT